MTTIIARASSADSEIDWVRGSRSTVVYTELGQTPSDEDPLVPWAVYAVDLGTGRKRRIAASKGPNDEIIQPFPSIEWPWVVDVAPPSKPSSETADIVAYDLRDGARSALVASRNPASVTIDHGLVFYDDTSGMGARDLFVVPVDGSSKPRRLTSSGRVALAIAANGAVTWQEPPQGDPDSLWYMLITRPDSPIRFAQEGSNAFPGQGVVLWYMRGELVAADPHNAQERAVLDSPNQSSGSIPSIPAKWSAFGDRVVWASDVVGDRPSSTIHVAVLRRS
jgi:hypothetical protein